MVATNNNIITELTTLVFCLYRVIHKSLRNFQTRLRNNQEERTAQLLLHGNLKSRPIFCLPLRVLIQISYPQNMSNYSSLYTVHCVHLNILMFWYQQQMHISTFNVFFYYIKPTCFGIVFIFRQRTADYIKIYSNK